MMACLLGWGAVSDLSLISDLSQKFKHDLWRVKSELNLSQKQHLTPGQRQAIIWTNAGILLIQTLGRNFSEILSENHTFSFK